MTVSMKFIWLPLARWSVLWAYLTASTIINYCFHYAVNLCHTFCYTDHWNSKKKKKNPEKCCDSSFYISLLKILYLNNRNLTGDSPAVGFLPHTVLRLPVGKLFSKCNDITNVLLFFIDLGSQQTRVKSLKQCLCLQKYPDLLVLMENHCFPALWVPLYRLWCCSS